MLYKKYDQKFVCIEYISVYFLLLYINCSICLMWDLGSLGNAFPSYIQLLIPPTFSFFWSAWIEYNFSVAISDIASTDPEGSIVQLLFFLLNYIDIRNFLTSSNSSWFEACPLISSTSIWSWSKSVGIETTREACVTLLLKEYYRLLGFLKKNYHQSAKSWHV